jgi:hypothetical protein
VDLNLSTTSTPWWQTDDYNVEEPVPLEFYSMAGEHGPMLVRAWKDGRTEPGWGIRPNREGVGFLQLYENKNALRRERALRVQEKAGEPFAFVMRSVQMICIDIDGKNGGLEGAKQLGPFPETMAETSKSGNGYHLFYLLPDVWDLNAGFGRLGDRIGIAPGVDIRGVGCVYHYPQQRWNERGLVELPQFMHDRLRAAEQKRAASAARIETIIEEGDPVEIAVLQDELVQDLKTVASQPGGRNNALFAIGSKMIEAGVDEWELKVHARALEVGLPMEEANKLIANIEAYFNKQ